MNDDKQLTKKSVVNFSIISVLTFLNYLYCHHHTSKDKTCKYLISDQTLNLVQILNKCTSTKINHNFFIIKTRVLFKGDKLLLQA